MGSSGFKIKQLRVAKNLKQSELLKNIMYELRKKE